MKNYAIRYIFGFVCLISLSACLREEIPVEPFDRGDAILANVSIQANYRDQVWYDLGTNQIVATNAKVDWEVGFLCADSVWGIRLNSSLAMQAASTGTNDFASVSSSSGLEFKPDHPSGYLDSMALYDIGIDQVYVLDLGYTPTGQQRGFRKIVLRSRENDQYQLQYAKLDGSEEQTINITKDPQYNFIGYSLSGNEKRLVEPPKDEYDLCFTQYMHIFYEPYQPYLVTGVLSNPAQTYVALDSVSEFDLIDATDVDRLYWDDAQDAIGYAWKYYDFNASAFTVFPEQVFMIRDNEGFLYKLHFLDFYDDSGNKGSPSFAFQRL
ncbi:MAG: HmuY family protein [Bacteroidota bacterium]